MLGIGIGGGHGRMGRALQAALAKDSAYQLRCMTLRPGTHDPLAVAVDKLEEGHFDVWIEFTRPAISLQQIAACVCLNKPLVLGTTGFSQEEEQIIEDASRHIPIVFAANMSIGVTLCQVWLAQAARVLGKATTCQITDIHHQHKLDSPSGTALAWAKAVTIGAPSLPVKIDSLREGEVVGIHTALFSTPEESVQIQHVAQSRAIFAEGALRAAAWVHTQPPGLYSMAQVLGL